jgi:peptidoglycan/xylan/chitin deacetylase (PgdA/CDA1 family)
LNLPSKDSFFSVMYHYVRPANSLKLEFIEDKNFERQLDFIQEQYGVVSGEDWNDFRSTGRLPKGALLTFDDGLKDHIETVIPILQKKKMFGIFYVCTDPFHGKPLPVHITHSLLATYSPRYILDLLEKTGISLGKNLHLDHKALVKYRNHNSDEITKNLKRIVNWANQDLGQREKIFEIFSDLTSLSQQDFVKSWYLSESDLSIINNLGFEIGSHTCSHRLLSNMEEIEIKNELMNSRFELAELTKSEIKSFCYPYGGPFSYNQKVIDEVQKAGYTECFSVSPNEINLHMNSKLSLYELPRYDCNIFPYYR